MGSPSKATDKPIGKQHTISLKEKVSISAGPSGGTTGGGAKISTATPEQIEAGKQAEIHGITEGEQFKSIRERRESQQEYQQLSPALREKYSEQIEEREGRREYGLELSETVGISDKPLTEQEEAAERITSKYDDPEFAQQYEAGKGLTTEGQPIPTELIGAGSEDIEKYNREAEAHNKAVQEEVERLVGKGFTVEQYNKYVSFYNPYIEKAREKEIAEIAGGIVKEAPAGATKIKLYTKEGEALGSIGIQGAEEPLATQLRTGEFQYSYYTPKTAEQKAELAKSKEEEKKFKAFISEYKEVGATFDITKEGKLIGVTSKEHPYYDIKKAQREGEVSISPTKKVLITEQRQATLEKGSKEKLAFAYATPFYNLAVFSKFAPQSMKEAIETTPKEASLVDRFTKGYSPKTTRETSLYELPDPTIEYLATRKVPEGYTQREIDAYLQANAALAFIGLGVKGGGVKAIKPVKATPAKFIVSQSSRTPTYRATNLYRDFYEVKEGKLITKPSKSSIFEYDTGEPSLPPKPPRPAYGADGYKSTKIDLGVGIGKIVPREPGGTILLPKKPVEPSQPPPKKQEPVKETESKTATGQVLVLEKPIQEQKTILKKPQFKSYPVFLGTANGKVETIQATKPITKTKVAQKQSFIPAYKPLKKEEQKTKQVSVIQKQSQLVSQKPIIKQKEQQRYKFAQIPKQKEKQKLVPLLKELYVPETKQAQLFRHKFIQTQEQDVVPKLVQKQQLEQLKITPLKEKPIILFESPSGEKRGKTRKERSRDRIEFIGNVPLREFAGVYKRKEITYGSKAVARLVGKDISLSRGKKASLFGRSRGIRI